MSNRAIGKAGAVGRPEFATKTTLSSDRRTLTVQIPVSFRSHRAGKQIVTPDGSDWSPSTRIDSALVQAIVRAHRWREMLEGGEGTAANLAKAEGVNDSYLSRILRLTLLSPGIIEAILNGHQPKTLELRKLLQPQPLDWPSQCEKLGFGCRTDAAISLPLR